MENQLEMPKAHKNEKRRPLRRQIVIACAMLLIAAALVLNFTLFGEKAAPVDPDVEAGDGAGDSTDTNTDVDGYFSATQVSRQRARDEALLVLQGVVDNENADEATKTGALLEISQLAKEMEAEANIEAMVVAKGFAQCVAIVNDDSCSVVVKSEGLMSSQISQINEIVYEQTGILPSGVRIITK
ncbi:MAG: SpoIIIAH-like family protein [Clostridia bacterium]|nr:SpoIIIAH-like family protein [Clostridia bacterium]